MNESKSIQDYYTKVTKILNKMKVVGEKVSDSKIAEKIFLSLPPKFDGMVSIIEETKGWLDMLKNPQKVHSNPNSILAPKLMKQNYMQ